jgi:hypothetical protein
MGFVFFYICDIGFSRKQSSQKEILVQHGFCGVWLSQISRLPQLCLRFSSSASRAYGDSKKTPLVLFTSRNPIPKRYSLAIMVSCTLCTSKRPNRRPHADHPQIHSHAAHIFPLCCEMCVSIRSHDFSSCLRFLVSALMNKVSQNGRKHLGHECVDQCTCNFNIVSHMRGSKTPSPPLIFLVVLALRRQSYFDEKAYAPRRALVLFFDS